MQLCLLFAYLFKFHHLLEFSFPNNLYLSCVIHCHFWFCFSKKKTHLFLWPSSSMADYRVHSRVMRVGELAMFLTSPKTPESMYCPSPRRVKSLPWLGGFQVSGPQVQVCESRREGGGPSEIPLMPRSRTLNWSIPASTLLMNCWCA